jgi:hypothetical protein
LVHRRLGRVGPLRCEPGLAEHQPQAAEGPWIAVADQDPALSAHRPSTAPSSAIRSGAVQERVDVGGELGVVLEEEAVRGVGVELESRVGDEAGQQV